MKALKTLICIIWQKNAQWARQFKIVQAKKLNKSISRIIVLTKIHFLNWRKCQKCNFTKFYLIFMGNIQRFLLVKLIYLISRVFLPRLFLFSGPLWNVWFFKNKVNKFWPRSWYVIGEFLRYVKMNTLRRSLTLKEPS